jgi:hypothetical protein
MWPGVEGSLASDGLDAARRNRDRGVDQRDADALGPSLVDDLDRMLDAMPRELDHPLAQEA